MLESAEKMRSGNTTDVRRMRSALVRVDGRTRGARRLRDLADSFADALGGWRVLTPLQSDAVRRAAELAVLAETARADGLRNGCSDLTALSQLEGKAEQAKRALGLPTVKPEPIPLRDQLAAEAALRDFDLESTS